MVSLDAVAGVPALKISLVYSPGPRRVCEFALQLEPGSCVANALSSCGVLQAFPEPQADGLEVGIWGRKTTLDCLLQDGDRVEIYRPLQVDPKVARRERFNQQGAKSAGLFAKTRVGAKAGY